MFPISRNWNLPVGPFTSQVDANTSNHSGLVLQAEGGEVQTVWRVHVCNGVHVNRRYASWSRSGVGHNRFHMLGKDKEKRRGAESFNARDTKELINSQIYTTICNSSKAIISNVSNIRLKATFQKRADSRDI